MFGALRRCPATLSRNLSTAAIAPKALRISSLSSLRATNALRIPSSRLANATTAGFHHSAKWQQIAAQAQAEEAIRSDGPITEFSDLAARRLVHPYLINTITKHMKLTTMTEVQTRTINEALLGNDV